MKRINILNLFILFTVLVGFCHAADNDGKQEPTYLAAVDIVDNKTDNNENKKKLAPTDRKITIKPQSKRIELSGYIDSSYVYLIIDIKDGRYVTGNIFRNGKPTYINGEYVNGVLYVYDNQGKRYTVINDNMDSQLFK